MTTVGRKGIAALSAAQMARSLTLTRTDYEDLASRLQWAVRDIALARSDSVTAAEKLAVVRLTVLAAQDSVRQERIAWKRGTFESRFRRRKLANERCEDGRLTGDRTHRRIN